jgi:hypothetical protein
LFTVVTPKLSKLIPRLASDHDGEVVATARAIERVLKASGHDWHDLAAMVAPPLAPVEAPPSDWREVARFCAGRSAELRPRELDLIASLAPARRTNPQTTQVAVRHRGPTAESKMNSAPSRYLHLANLAAACEQQARKTKYGSPLQSKLVRLAAIYREMANAAAPVSAFAEDRVFEIGPLAESRSLQQGFKTLLSEEQEDIPLSGGRGEKPRRPTTLSVTS